MNKTYLKGHVVRIQVLLLMLTLASTLLLTACSGTSRPLNESGIAEIIPSGITGRMTVTDVTVDRRQTEGGRTPFTQS